MAENIDGEMARRILDEVPGAPWAFRLDPGAGTSAWLYRSPQLAETYALTEAEIQGSPLDLVRRLPPDEAAALHQRLMASMATLSPMGWLERVALPEQQTRWVETRVRFQREESGTLLVFGQSFDVTEQKRAENLYRGAIDALPAVIFAMTPTGELPIYNRAAREYVGTSPVLADDDTERRYGMFRTDGVTPFPHAESPIVRALQGEEAPMVEVIIKNPSREDDLWVEIRGTPMRDEAGRIIAGLVISQDLTAIRGLERDLRTRNDQLAASEEEKSALIDRLRLVIEDLTSPILEVWDDVLVLPIIGVIDPRRATDMAQRLLVEVARTQASFVIIDITGVEILDGSSTDRLFKLVRKVELLGARCVLTGIRPSVADFLVEMDLDLDRITTLRNLKHGLREALRAAQRERDGQRDDGDATRGEPRGKSGARPPR